MSAFSALCLFAAFVGFVAAAPMAGSNNCVTDILAFMSNSIEKEANTLRLLPQNFFDAVHFIDGHIIRIKPITWREVDTVLEDSKIILKTRILFPVIDTRYNCALNFFGNRSPCSPVFASIRDLDIKLDITIDKLTGLVTLSRTNILDAKYHVEGEFMKETILADGIVIPAVGVQISKYIEDLINDRDTKMPTEVFEKCN